MAIITFDSIKNKLQRFSPRFEQNLFLLFLSSQIKTIGINLLGTFGIVFFYEKLDKSILFLLIYYLLSSLLYVFWAPINGKIVCKIGLKKSIIIGSILFALLNISYILFDYNLFWAIVSSTILAIISRGFYWMPYHIYFASFTNKDRRGFQISIVKDVVTIINIFLPFIAGLFIEESGFNIIFIISIFLHLISIIPLLKMDDIKVEYSFNYLESFKKIFSKEFWHDSILFFLEGAESTFSVILWPLLMFLILKGNYQELGIISSCIVLFTIILNIILGKMADKQDKKKMVKTGALLYSAGWIMKMFSYTGFQVFLSSLYHNMADSLMRVPYDTYWYEQDFKKGRYIDEYVILREATIHAGRSLTIVMSMLLINNLGFDMRETFVIGALAFLLLGFFIDKKSILVKNDE